MYSGSEHIEHTTQYGGEVQLLHYRVLAYEKKKFKYESICKYQDLF